MKFIITVIIVVGLAVGGWQFYNYWNGFKAKDGQPTAAVDVPVEQLPGLPPALEPRLQAAQQSAKNFHEFLTTYGKSIADPRLSSIELDYVVLVAHTDIAEARRMFSKVKQHIEATSPVYPRYKLLEKTYDQSVTP